MGYRKMSECIKFSGNIYALGYGQFSRNKKNVFAHRDAWEKVNGIIPKGFVIDHQCHNEAVMRGECAGGNACSHRACVNIEHLRLVTYSENTKAGKHGFDARAECPQGHSYSDERNVLIRKNGYRECAECNRARGRTKWANRNVVTI